MRSILRFVAAALVVLGGWAAPASRAYAANLDTTADRVFGQPDFTHGDPNHGGLSANSLYYTENMALDRQGNLYVADTDNNRVLEYDAPLTAGATADRVFGQPDFNSNAINNGGVSANSLNSPFGVAVDAANNLYVADTFNSRVLEYDTPLTAGATADRVFGQPDFNSNIANNGGVNAISLSGPSGVALDSANNLYVADSGNNRVLEYDTPLAAGATADRVFGQPDYTSNASNNGGVSANSLNSPHGVAVDGQGNLYVADLDNNRVLEYNTPLTAGTAADRVFGQPDFTSNTANNGGLSANSLLNPLGVALDAANNLYVADTYNNRVLEFDTPLTAGATADHVFGQPDFISDTFNNGGLSANSLNLPYGVAVDAANNLYVADTSNNRVLEYDVPIPHGLPQLAALSPSTVAAGSPAFTLTVNGSGFVAGSIVRWNGGDRPTTLLNTTQLNAAISPADVASGGPFAVTVFTPAPGGGASSLVNLTLYGRAGQDATADLVLGQPNFVAQATNNALLPSGANRLDFPEGATVDTRTGRLFVADLGNNRVLSWPNALALANGQAADLVIGQPDFTARTANTGGVSASNLNNPFGVAVDGQGNLYVADSNNNRVLEYAGPLTTGMAAGRVFGQGGSFTTALANNGGVGANSLDFPEGVAVDGQGNLYVADSDNNRVLEYDAPLTAGTTADRVFGQPDFTQGDPNHGGLSAGSLNFPTGLAVDRPGNLYVADNSNHRVLEYDSPLAGGTGADRVFGQPDFTHNTPGTLSATSLVYPDGVTLDDLGNLYVADVGNDRVLEYFTPLIPGGGATADRVFGQPDFTSNGCNNGGLGAASLCAPEGVAVDGQRNLYVVDYGNSRVLEYDWALVRLMLPFVRR